MMTWREALTQAWRTAMHKKPAPAPPPKLVAVKQPTQPNHDAQDVEDLRQLRAQVKQLQELVTLLVQAFHAQPQMNWPERTHALEVAGQLGLGG